MATYQFIHVDSYSRTLSKKAKNAKWTAKDVINEATRQPGAIPHISSPKPPIHIFGAPIGQLLTTLDEWALGTKDSKGRSARKDAVCLLSGVFSMPAGTHQEDWLNFKNDTILWLKKKYGNRLRTVIEHIDEDHPHCHFYVVPNPGESFEVVHQGRHAVKAFVSAGGDKRSSNDVYRMAMRSYQDEFFSEVGMRNGLTRIGPRRRRLTRAAWQAEKQQAESFKKQCQLAEEMVKNADAFVKLAEIDSEVIVNEALGEAENLVSSARSERLKIIGDANKESEKIKSESKVKGYRDAVNDFEGSGFLGKIKIIKRVVGDEYERIKNAYGELLKKFHIMERKLAASETYIKENSEKIRVASILVKENSALSDKVFALEGRVSVLESDLSEKNRMVSNLEKEKVILVNGLKRSKRIQRKLIEQLEALGFNFSI